MKKILVLALILGLTVFTVNPVAAQEITLDESEYTFGSTSEFAQSELLGDEEALADTGSSSTVIIAAGGFAVVSALAVIKSSRQKNSYKAR